MLRSADSDVIVINDCESTVVVVDGAATGIQIANIEPKEVLEDSSGFTAHGIGATSAIALEKVEGISHRCCLLLRVVCPQVSV